MSLVEMERMASFPLEAVADAVHGLDVFRRARGASILPRRFLMCVSMVRS
jgi:hypothetical protein